MIATDCLFPGSAWEHTASEAPPQKAGGACKALRSQAEPGNEVRLASAEVTIKALAKNMKAPQTPLFVKTHDFIVWLLKHTNRFPKNLRHSYTNRLEGTALDFQEAILMANVVRGKQRREFLEIADGKLLFLRSLLRYTIDLQLLGSRQIKYASECVDELGRLLGAWRKGTDR